MAGIESGLGTTLYRSTIAVQVRSFNKTERDALMAILTSRVGDVFDEDGIEPFFWSARASNNKIDAYYTHMQPSSLKNYARDADDGVQFQVSHNGAGTGGLFGGGSAGEVGFGRSLRGKFTGEKSADPQTLIDFYTVPGLTCGNMTSDQFILGARTGIYSDVSIGFMPGQFVCDICGGDMLKRWELDWDDPERCTHYLGMEYEVEGKRGKKVICTAGVENAHLNEVSVVYDGATPEAGILAVDMARMAVARGELEWRDVQLMERVYRVNIPLPPSQYGGVTMTGKKKDENTNELTTEEPQEPTTREVPAGQVREVAPAQENTEPTGETITFAFEDKGEDPEPEERQMEPMERVRDKFRGTGIGIPEGIDPYRAMEILGDKVLELNARIRDLEPLAKDGELYRNGLLRELDEAVVRAYGGDGADERKARYQRMVKGEDVDFIRSMIADLEETARKRLGEGGRLTRDDTTLVGVVDDTTPASKRPEKRGPTPAHLIVG